MPEPNGRMKWYIISTLVGVAMLILTFGAGWVTSVRTDAAFRQRTESHLEESDGYGADIAELKTDNAVTNIQIINLIESQRRTNETLQRLADKMDLLIQAEMRKGNIAR